MQRPWLIRPQRFVELRPQEECAKRSNFDRWERDPRYNTHRWHKAAAAYRTAHPLCAECQRHGRISPTEVVDHIKPAPICTDAEFWSESNWQPLCRQCNNRKGQRDKRIIAEYRRNNLKTDKGGGVKSQQGDAK